MPPREILDSEDDGSDFGDEYAGFNYNDQGSTDEVDVIDVPHDIEVAASHINSVATGSTDPSFFQRVYDQHQLQQQTISDTQSVVPDTVPNTIRPPASEGAATGTGTSVSLPPPPGLYRDADDDYLSLTSITDPAPPTGRPSARRKSRVVPNAVSAQAEVVDLTGVTTPRKSADDAWEATGTPSTKSRRAASVRTYGKRNAAQLSLEQEAGEQEHGYGGGVDDPLQKTPATLPPTLDPYAFPAATPPTRRSARGSKGRRGVLEAANPQSMTTQEFSSSPVMLVPTEETPRRSNRKRKAAAATTEAPGSSSGMSMLHMAAAADAAAESSLPDTLPPSLYVQPSTPTTSQKQEYRVVYLSSQPGSLEPVIHQQQSLVPGVGGGDTVRSSDATVAYPRPSRIGSSREERAGFDETDGVGDMGYQSSPDVLIDMTASTSSTRSKRARVKAVSSGGLVEPDLEAPPSTTRTKKRRVFHEVDDSDDEFHQESNNMPQQIVQDEDLTIYEETADNGRAVAEVEDINNGERMEAIATPAPKAPAKGKRGRKKKVVESSAGQAVSAAEPTPAATTPSEPPAKRKRGRPRKSETISKPVEPVEQPEPPVAEAARTGAEQDPEVSEEPSAQPFSELEHNSQPGPASGAEGSARIGENVTDEKENSALEEAPAKVKGDDRDTGELTTKGKDASAATGKSIDIKGKVKYRVGLNRMSRVPSLLKVIKKPT
ncbi:hypothetical protein VTJ49DRAFT_4765 [Mycothermus thermophilus]|uniref:AT hook domain-containing protein n=1 Tax=Humicola insolens TaxID=85995 RepID=A0ABR3VLD7_HUMIN